jgi:hypothetical protein
VIQRPFILLALWIASRAAFGLAAKGNSARNGDMNKSTFP